MYSSVVNVRTALAGPVTSIPTAARTTGSGSVAARTRRSTSASSRAAASRGDVAAATRSPTSSAEPLHNSSKPTVRSTRSPAGARSTGAAAPGRSRTPTITVPGVSSSRVRSDCIPITCGRPPSTQTTSTLPFGTAWNTYGGESGPTSWTQTQLTYGTSPAAGGRSR
jgi:hypothetical protein